LLFHINERHININGWRYKFCTYDKYNIFIFVIKIKAEYKNTQQQDWTFKLSSLDLIKATRSLKTRTLNMHSHMHTKIKHKNIATTWSHQRQALQCTLTELLQASNAVHISLVIHHQ